ncbi:MAG: hypothetical protein ABS62_06215 [Microbacterium sp. SCN 70-200]|uniref:DUF2017 family protein n=1 Tax=unclassified Microbacterium TaxID=2609290 RepID=UPI00086A75BB|nr:MULTISPECIES: DUF2017 family protein [unclassified Microbacterium]MBN9214544.1 DUF2017 family protein [Microbacterium sp.]ODT41438.1 MAG: hypothetical protein ABS62_06215 [Microbacterium sp. SCN 70-200]OJV84082.1 MAG: hypothetical protein BGO46_14140 [Microbacterium sp. 70-16]
MTKLLMEMSLLEAAHLTGLVEQFAELIAGTVDEDGLDDPAILRLVPDAYRDDAEAAAEFRGLTQGDLLDRRRDDAGLVLTTLQRDGVTLHPGDVAAADATSAFVVELDAPAASAWLRTLTSIRLVMATRIGISSDDEQGDPDDPRVGVYEWLGFRLEGLLQALED